MADTHGQHNQVPKETEGTDSSNECKSSDVRQEKPISYDAGGSVVTIVAQNPLHQRTIPQNRTSAAMMLTQSNSHASLTPQAPSLPFFAGYMPNSLPLSNGALSLSSIPAINNSIRIASARSYGQTPKVFLNRKLRSGKWIPEEEKYAELLIDLFEKGRVEGCENGCTLRSYLSQKLHCAPMRISKKYAGKGIGKMVYVSKDGDAVERSEDHEALLRKVQAAQDKFHEAVCSSREPVMPPAAAFLPGFGPPSNICIFPGLPTMMQPSHVVAIPGVTPVLSQGLLPIHSTVQLPQLPVATQCISNYVDTDGKLLFQPHSTSQPTTQKPLSAVEASQRQLRESFLIALNQTKQEISIMNHPGSASMVARAEPAPTQYTLPLSQPPPSVSSDGSRISGQANPSHNNSKTHPATTEQPQVNRPLVSLPPVIVSAPEQPQSADVPLKPLTTKELPDFLAGFDSVGQNPVINREVLPQSAMPTNSMSPYSPPFTTRSFDDLHVFLENDAIQLGNANNSPHHAAEAKEKLIPRIPCRDIPQERRQVESAPFFTAESYAIFALESAMAASQHDAYLSHGFHKEPEPTRKHTVIGKDVDIDRMVELVSDHVSHHMRERGIEQSGGVLSKQCQESGKTCQSKSENGFRQGLGLSLSKVNMDSGKSNPIPTTLSDIVTSSKRFSREAEDYRYVSGSEPSEPSSNEVNETEWSNKGSLNSESSDNSGNSESISCTSDIANSDSTVILMSSTDSDVSSSDESQYRRKRNRGTDGENHANVVFQSGPSNRKKHRSRNGSFE